jgi:hypothetical protein
LELEVVEFGEWEAADLERVSNLLLLLAKLGRWLTFA